MRVLNIHERNLPIAPARVGELLDTLASPNDRLWPKAAWPRMAFDRPLGVGADGGHGPIRYVVAAYDPGVSVVFRFKGPRGFDGGHRLDVIARPDGTTILRHTLEMEAHGLARVTWPLAFRHLHDALVEDALALAQTNLGLPPDVHPWSWWVKLLRWTMTGGKANPQSKLGNSFEIAHS
jgi:hypothetical protein